MSAPVEMLALEHQAPAAPVVGGGFWRASLRRLRANRLGMACGLVIVLIALAGIAAPLLTDMDPGRSDLSKTFLPPGGEHLLGTDDLGRDVFARLLYGTRISLGVALLAVVMALTVGTSVGLLAAFYGGWVDEVLMRFVDMLLAIPPVFLFILLGILIEPGVVTLAAIIAFVFWAPMSRLVRSEALSIKERDYVLAARLLGANDLRLLARHILPNVLPIIIVSASLAMAEVMLVEAALDFLGLGIHPPTPSWGNMLTNAQNYFGPAPLLVIIPGAVIFVAVLAANLFGNAVRDAFDPRLRHR
jgi:peptide/nickel transport system permease protein